LIHTAALKSIDLFAYNAMHGIRTNIDGTINIVKCALESPTFERMCYISSDKAVNPCSPYGSTKLLGEGVMSWAQNISKKKIFCSTRSGNFYGSLMSVVPKWQDQAKEGKPLTITNPDMMRYFIKTEDMADFVLNVLPLSVGGEIFIPGKEIMKEYRMIEIADSISKNHVITGARPGERLREPLWSPEEEHLVEIFHVPGMGDCYRLKTNL
jgi:FlaA1/EpsC-like NDP-sugar epimerase